MIDLEKLKQKIEAMTPADQLRLAAGLLEQRRADLTKLAHTIVDRVGAELGAVLLLSRSKETNP